MNFISKYFTSKAITTYLIVVVACFVLFAGQGLPLIWIVFGLVEVITFFYFTNLLTRLWANIPDQLFQKELFTTALVIRIVYVTFIYFFYLYMTEKPFEFEAADSEGYHIEAVWIVDLFESGNLNYYFNHYLKGFSDSGFPIWLSIIYFFSDKSIFVARLVNALVGAWMCVLIYKLARRNFGDGAGRISAILAMLLPTFIYYCGLHLKETIMGFLLVAFAERADYLIRIHNFKIWSTIIVILLGTILFFFRTVLAVTAWFALFSTLLFSSNQLIARGRKTIYISWFVIFVLVIISGRVLSDVEGVAKDRYTNQKSQMEYLSTRKGANTLAKYGNATVFGPMMLFAPFPALVYVEDQPNAMMTNGNVFTRNVYAFFVVIALFVLYKKKLLFDHVLVVAIPVSYLAVLALSGFALSERFHMPAVPFLLILAGYGVTQLKRKYVRLYIPYLVIIGLVILGWNWFKLAGRGLI